MSGILDLAKAFEETSKQQAQRTGESVKSEFVKLEQSISEALTYRKLKNQSIPLSTPYAT